MLHFDIVREAKPAKSFRVASVIGTFDLQTDQVKEHFVGDIEVEPDGDWQIGLIVGNSGTGKTTIAKELFPDAYITNYKYEGETILDDMPEGRTVEEITKAFSSVGFSSTPSWLKPYAVLSNGEKMRVDIARALLEPNPLVVFDEFTSVVDRNIAKISSFAVQKAIRRSDKKFIAVGCHFDVEDWLLPDWVFDTNSMTFRMCEGSKKKRPGCQLRIYEIPRRYNSQYWNVFKRYHYLNHELSKSARCWVATLNGDLCAFTSVLPFVGKLKNTWRGHRTVVLPDFQGIGLASIFKDYVGDLLKSEGKEFLTMTSNPKLITSMAKNPKWQTYRFGRVGKHGITAKTSSANRITASFRYLGEQKPPE